MIIGENKNKKKINLLLILGQLDAGGSERMTLELAKNLDSKLFQIYLVYFKAGSLEKNFIKLCHETFYLQKKDGLDIKLMFKIARIIFKNKIHVINAHHYMPFFYGFLGSKILNKRKLIYTEHSVPEVEDIFKGSYSIVKRTLLRSADSIIGVSKEITNTFKQLIKDRELNIYTVINGVNIDKYSFAPDKNIFKKEIGLDSTRFVIGCVGNFRKVKNHICLIKAFNLFNKKFPDTNLVLVGKGFLNDTENSEEDIKHKIKMNDLEGKVILTGYRSDIPNLLNTFDIFCLPSLSEGLPISLLEAMATKTPVVGSNVRGINEVIINNETGILFTSNDHIELAEKLEKLFIDKKLREKIVENAYAYVRSNHSLKEWANNYQSIIIQGLN